MRFNLRLAPLLVAVSLTACGGSEPPTFEKLAKSIDNLQCEPPRFTRAQVDAEIAAAGLTVRSESCAFEVIFRTADCGSPVPYLNVIEVLQEQAATARALGYQSPSSFIDVVPMDCPAQ